MLSKKTKYALKAVLHLAEEYGKPQPILISGLAQKNRIPKKFLELILLELKNKGLLLSKKGKGGGYLLARNPRDISLGEVIPFLEEMVESMPCLHPQKSKRCEECRDLHACSVRMLMKEVSDSVSRVLNLTTLADLVERTRRAEAGMYYI